MTDCLHDEFQNAIVLRSRLAPDYLRVVFQCSECYCEGELAVPANDTEWGEEL